jgi:hypothetical protein
MPASMALAAALLVCVAGCNHGNDLGTEHTDLAPPAADLTPHVDLAMKSGPSCGEIAMCAIQCGQDLACYQKCVMGATPDQLTALGGLLFCAGTNCLQMGDGGFGLGNINQGQLLMCLLQKCPMQLSMCSGLFGGF